MTKNYSYILFFLGYTVILSAQESSSVAYIGASGCMEYIADEENNYIPDFSYAGYKGGGIPLPIRSEKEFIVS